MAKSNIPYGLGLPGRAAEIIAKKTWGGRANKLKCRRINFFSFFLSANFADVFDPIHHERETFLGILIRGMRVADVLAEHAEFFSKFSAVCRDAREFLHDVPGLLV